MLKASFVGRGFFVDRLLLGLRLGCLLLSEFELEDLRVGDPQGHSDQTHLVEDVERHHLMQSRIDFLGLGLVDDQTLRVLVPLHYRGLGVLLEGASVSWVAQDVQDFEDFELEGRVDQLGEVLLVQNLSGVRELGGQFFFDEQMRRGFFGVGKKLEKFRKSFEEDLVEVSDLSHVGSENERVVFSDLVSERWVSTPKDFFGIRRTWRRSPEGIPGWLSFGLWVWP